MQFNLGVHELFMHFFPTCVILQCKCIRIKKMGTMYVFNQEAYALTGDNERNNQLQSKSEICATTGETMSCESPEHSDPVAQGRPPPGGGFWAGPQRPQGSHVWHAQEDQHG